jgi:hypothetical protein
VVLFVVGALLAYRSFAAGVNGFGWGFTLFALAEISYMTYHLDWTVFLFAHTISEVLDVLAFVVIFVTATRRAFIARPVRSEAAGLGRS